MDLSSVTLLKLLTGLSVIGVGYGIISAIYRLIFHPLARFPGPKIAAATYWYDFYHDCVRQGQGVYNVERLHKLHGPVVRINPDEVSVNDPEFFDVLYNSGRRDKWTRNHKANGSPGSIATTISREHHRLRRQPVTNFFSKRSVDILESKIRTNVATMIEGIRSQCAKPQRILPIGTAFTALTLDVISDYCFGQSWHCLATPDFSPEWKRAMTGLFEPVPIVKQFPWINQIIPQLPLAVLSKIAPDFLLFLGAKSAVEKQIERIVTEREASSKSGTALTSIGSTTGDVDDTPPRTVFHAILDSPLPPTEKAIPRLTDEGFVMIVAGDETTAKALTIAVYHLLANPRWYTALQAELATAGPDARLADLERLPLLTAIVRETLRISSPVTNRLQLIEPVQALQCGEWTIPPGTPVSMSVPAIHLDHRLFPEPRVFDPERWMGESGKENLRYYMPFSRGTRGCLGMNLAYAELYHGIAAVVRAFDLELVDVIRERDVDVVRDCFVGMPSKESKGVNVRIVRER